MIRYFARFFNIFRIIFVWYFLIVNLTRLINLLDKLILIC